MVLFAAFLVGTVVVATVGPFMVLQALFPTRECRSCGHRGWDWCHGSCPRCGAWGSWWTEL